MMPIFMLVPAVVREWKGGGDVLRSLNSKQRTSPFAWVKGRNMSQNDTERALRSDARRNRDHILDVAERHFTEHGVTGSLNEIAKGAGVGPGTLYRHFPSRDDLLAALLTARDEKIGVQRAAITSTVSDPGEALAQWLAALVDWARAFEGLPEPLRAAISETNSPLSSTCEGYITSTDEFLCRAKEAGVARVNVRARDLFLLALAVSWARGAVMADSASGHAMGDVLRHGWASTH
jgi:AcrR family transcriptional regulator